MLEIGSVLDGKYKILNEIGHGGMSVVYLALNERANKTWAVKEVRKDGGNDNEIVSQGLIAETEMLKKLNHPNLPSIVDVIDTKDTFIIVMDYIEGRSLQSVLNHSGAQDPERVLEWSKQLCDVLGYLHSRQPAIIYRDMKPANVMLRPDGQVALIDFGTAREYKEHSQGDTTWLGTRGYAAPEQFGGRGQTDARTDIYCLGATMYHLLTGYSPADTQFVIYPIGQLIPSLAGSGLEKVVAKCCAPDPANRYQSCAELMYALEHVHDEDAKAVSERNRKWKLFVASFVITAIGLTGIIGFGITGKVAENKTYDSKYKAAQTVDDSKEKQERCAELMDLKPEKAEAYSLMLSAMEEPSSESGEKITSSEHKILEDAFIKHKDDFRKGNRKQYLEFQYQRGMDYFSYFTGNKAVTKAILDDISDDEKLDDEDYRKKVARCLSIFCSIYVMESTPDNVEAGNTMLSDLMADDSDKTGKNDYVELWENVESIASAPAKIDEITGSPILSAIIYREAAKQTSNYSVRFQNAGVSKERMQDLMLAGKKYIDSANAGSDEKYSAALDEAEEAISEALDQITRKNTKDPANVSEESPGNADPAVEQNE